MANASPKPECNLPFIGEEIQKYWENANNNQLFQIINPLFINKIMLSENT
jgi:hypothetical protein